jgi:hypothetical protein
MNLIESQNLAIEFENKKKNYLFQKEVLETLIKQNEISFPDSKSVSIEIENLKEKIKDLDDLVLLMDDFANEIVALQELKYKKQDEKICIEKPKGDIDEEIKICV